MMRGVMAAVAAAVLAGCAAADSGESDTTATAPEYEPSPADREAIVATLQSVFDALESGDGDLLRSVMDPDVTMHFSETNARGETLYGSSTLDGLATRIETSEEPLIERMWDPVVWKNGGLATIWTPYDFYVGDTSSHCGVDAATLIDDEGGWRVVSLSWTRLQPPACPLHPEGPPGG